MKRIVGLTGMTGSGKSTICRVMLDMGAHILDADCIARQLQRPGQQGYSQIGKHFGEEYLLPDGLDRKKLAGLVFNNRDRLNELNNIMFPLITQRILSLLKELDGLCIIDAALLFEAGINKICDEVWVAIASDDVRLERIMNRDGINKAQAMERMKSQQPAPEPAAVVLDTTQGMQALMPKLKYIYENRQDIKR